jgi:hypothetical protein
MIVLGINVATVSVSITMSRLESRQRITTANVMKGMRKSSAQMVSTTVATFLTAHLMPVCLEHVSILLGITNATALLALRSCPTKQKVSHTTACHLFVACPPNRLTRQLRRGLW